MSSVLRFAEVDCLVGREDECQLLQDAYQRVLASPRSCEAILLHGESGTGKTALVQRCFLRQLEEGTLVSGKFDITNNARPYSAIVDAFTQLCQTKAWSNTLKLEELEDNRHRKLSTSDVQLLTKLVPVIKQRVGSRQGDESNEEMVAPYSPSSNYNTFAFARFAEVLRTFLHLVARCLPSPLILFLDDVQAADAESLSLISSLAAAHSETCNLLLLLAYRDKQSGGDFKQNQSNILPDTTLFRVTDIQLSSLGTDDVNKLVSMLLRVDAEESSSLSQLISQRTGGNIYFMLQFLEMLKSEKLLVFSFGTCRWEWNLEKIRADTNVTDNVAALLTSKIRQLPPAVQSTLQIAACLGFYFDVRFLERIVAIERASVVRESSKLSLVKSGETLNVNDATEPVVLTVKEVDKSVEIANAIAIAVKESLIDRAEGTTYKFTHDRVLEATYDMIPAGSEKEILHWHIGQVLWTELQHRTRPHPNQEQFVLSRSDDWLLFAAADQLNRGSDCELMRNDKVTTIALSQLNLQAGKATFEKSAFKYAAGFFDRGVKLMEGMWGAEYSLCLELHTRSAEAEYAASNFEMCDQRACDILANGQCLEDKLPAYFLKVKSQGVRGQILEAIDESIAVLWVLGERVPRRPNLLHLLWEVKKMKRLMKGTKTADLVSLPDMTDSMKIWVTRFLQNVVVLSWYAGKNKSLLMYACRMMQLTVKYGVSSQGPYVIATYGVILGLLGDLDGAYAVGRVAMEIAKRPHTAPCYACSVGVIHVFLHHLRQPLVQCLDHLMNGYNVGIKSGEIEGAALCLTAFAALGIYFGKKLDVVLAEMEGFRQAYRNEVERNCALICTTPMYQYVLDLTGRSGDSPKLLVDSTFVESYLLVAQRTGNEAAKTTLIIVRLMFLYIMCHVEEASHEVGKFKLEFVAKGTHFATPFLLMYAGLTMLAMARKTGMRKFWRRANVFKQIMEKFAKAGNLNMPPMLQLMSAEQTSIRRRSSHTDDVKKAYESAMRIAAQSGFSVVEAIGNERAGEYMQSMGDTFWAETYFTRAFLLYEEWGAEAKTKQMMNEHTFLAVTSRPTMKKTINLTLRKQFSYKESDERRQMTLER